MFEVQLLNVSICQTFKYFSQYAKHQKKHHTNFLTYHFNVDFLNFTLASPNTI